jgi:NTP pyrophosphatase (non-canonical NTP hydrolase)
MSYARSTIPDLIDASWNTAETHGWHTTNRGVPEIIALMHSELSEALEEYRSAKPVTEIYFSDTGKPEGFPVELADVLIRIFDACGEHGIDLAQAIELKMIYNETRPYRHGGKLA